MSKESTLSLSGQVIVESFSPHHPLCAVDRIKLQSIPTGAERLHHDDTYAAPVESLVHLNLEFGRVHSISEFRRDQ